MWCLWSEWFGHSPIRRALEEEFAPGVVLFHVALEGLLVAGQLVAVQVENGQGSELASIEKYIIELCKTHNIMLTILI